jgi:two-component system sensor histidine kinase KdpD
VGIAVASVVDLAARRAQQAARGRAESEVLAALAMAAALPVEGAEGDPPGGAAGAPGASAEPGPGAARDESATRGATPYATPPPSGRTPTAAPYGAPAAPAAGDGIDALLARVRETFAVDSAALLERTGEPGRTVWRRAAAVGAGAAGRPEEADVEVPVGERLVLALNGRVLPAEDRRLLGAFAAQTAALLERRRLAAEAVRARRLAEGNRIRTALLAAVSHDLRTPLAGIKAAVSSLRGEEVEWSPQDEAELLAAIEAGADRLDHLIGNLLDMSRLHTGTVSPLLRDVGLDEVVPAALAELPAGSVQLDVPEHLPRVRVDPGLLERAVANVVENAVKHSPAGTPVTVRAAPAGGAWVELRVVDHGPGVPEEARARIFEPFQRFGDTARGTGAGVGLGLAVARGFTEAMGGTLAARATSGGGLTMVLTLPVSDPGPGSPGSPDSPGSPGEDCTERDDEGQARR